MTSIATAEAARTVPRLGARTIADFGQQWQAFPRNDGYYASAALFADLVGPLVNLDDLAGARIADIGSGTGRIVNMLLAAGAAHVTAVEPSAAFEVLERNLAADRDRVRCLRARGDELPADDFDYVFSMGVLHHIPDPAATVVAAYKALRPSGKLIVWLYGREGNRLYLACTTPARAITTRLPHAVLAALAQALSVPLSVYIAACRWLPLPLQSYMRGHLGKLAWRDRTLTIYDQLRPAYAKYYRQDEVRALLSASGFRDVRLYHRHGYSWTAVGTKTEN